MKVTDDGHGSSNNYLNFASLLTLGWIWQNALPILEERHEFEKAQAEDERNRLARFEICGLALEILAFLHPCLEWIITSRLFLLLSHDGLQL